MKKIEIGPGVAIWHTPTGIETDDLFKFAAAPGEGRPGAPLERLFWA